MPYKNNIIDNYDILVQCVWCSLRIRAFNFRMIAQQRNRRNVGMTLIELTLVIAVLLGLISALFVGALAYKNGSDRAECLVISASVQKAVRSYQNLYQLTPGDSLDHLGTLVGTDGMFAVEPECPKYGVYVWETTVPASGVPYIDCNDPNNTAIYHYPQNRSGW